MKQIANFQEKESYREMHIFKVFPWSLERNFNFFFIRQFEIKMRIIDFLNTDMSA